ncbi:hypothetical protein FB451DRAFT_1513150 [Mycena latifolia]|nr:hypothetical protein FB451DRAFT_1513150 [Mycena latifolia]
MATTTSITSSANDLLAAHSALILQFPRPRFWNCLYSDYSIFPTISSGPGLYARLCTAADLPPARRARVARYKNHVPEEETIQNDYSQRYLDGSEWPQSWVFGADPEHRFEESSPSPRATDPTFVFMWAGSGAGEVLTKWGYRTSSGFPAVWSFGGPMCTNDNRNRKRVEMPELNSHLTATANLKRGRGAPTAEAKRRQEANWALSSVGIETRLETAKDVRCVAQDQDAWLKIKIKMPLKDARNHAPARADGIRTDAARARLEDGRSVEAAMNGRREVDRRRAAGSEDRRRRRWRGREETRDSDAAHTNARGQRGRAGMRRASRNGEEEMTRKAGRAGFRMGGNVGRRAEGGGREVAQMCITSACAWKESGNEMDGQGMESGGEQREGMGKRNRRAERNGRGGDEEARETLAIKALDLVHRPPTTPPPPGLGARPVLLVRTLALSVRRGKAAGGGTCTTHAPWCVGAAWRRRRGKRR